MRALRFFYVVRINDAQTQNALNAMRFAAAPDAKRTAHITVRGPCARPLPAEKIAQLTAAVRNAPVAVNGAGVFFRRRQNTVFLQCDSPAFPAIWKKPGREYIPHITIYDGSSREKAEDIIAVLQNANISFARPAGEVSEMPSPPDPRASELREALCEKTLSAAAGKKTTAEDIPPLPWQQRLQIIKTLAQTLPA